MICRNCNNEIDDSAEFCPICNVYVSTCQVATQEIHTKQTFVLVLENGAKFDIQPEVNTTVTIGRADLSSRPDIDLGPYDDGPYISRLQGEFFDKNGVVFYKNLGKNPTIINDKKINNNDCVKISDKDKITFVNINGKIVHS